MNQFNELVVAQVCAWYNKAVLQAGLTGQSCKGHAQQGNPTRATFVISDVCNDSSGGYYVIAVFQASLPCQGLSVMSLVSNHVDSIQFLGDYTNNLVGALQAITGEFNPETMLN